ncbi:uncharacterized protein [Ptychodera flava]|uniref:uncharacterized protein n=1 Tax=Ptychodera flava TaxID=63121 RepID=UPI00396A6570
MFRLPYYVSVVVVCFVVAGQCFSSTSDPEALFGADIDRGLFQDQYIQGLVNRAPKRVPISVIRAFMGRRFLKQGFWNQKILSQGDDVLYRVMMFRMIGLQMGKKIVNEMEKKKEENRVYNLGMWLSCDCASEYIDDSGRYRGFFLDLAEGVCREAGKKCVYQVVTGSECITHQNGELPHAGKALLGKQVDICLGWFKTPARKLSLDYTEPLSRLQGKVVFVVKSANPNNFDPNDITGKTIGFEDGLLTDKACLLHAKGRITGVDTMQPQQEVYKETIELLFDDLRKDKIDSFLGLDSRVAPYLGEEFETIGDDIGCILEDALYGIKRKDNSLTWFDETLRAMRKSGKYHALCQQARHEHGHKGTFVCVDE